MKRAAHQAGALLLSVLVTSCGASPPHAPAAAAGPAAGTAASAHRVVSAAKGFGGMVVAPEPNAAQVGQQILAAGGDAADAAVAMGFALSVTLPSRAGLGAAGACLAFEAGAKAANGGTPRAILFTPQAAAVPPSAAADRPAALPLLPRGLYLLHHIYGHLPFEQLVAPAAEMARAGVPASRPLVRDLDVVAQPLFADPGAQAVFAPGGRRLTVGTVLRQPELAAVLARIKLAGVGDFYQGELARLIVQGSAAAGGPIGEQALRQALASVAAPLVLPYGTDRVAFLPPPADGGLAAAAAFETLAQHPAAVQQAAARALAVAAAWRNGGGSAAALLHATPPAASLPPLPASATFLAVDRTGGAVICATTMDNLFGTGRMVPGLGFLLAASPARTPPPLLAAALAWNPRARAFRAAVGGAGQDGAALAAAVAMANTLRTGQAMPVTVPEPGRANVIACSRYLPGGGGRCAAVADPRGLGMAAGAIPPPPQNSEVHPIIIR
jgi:gamma-glutamyltranspeptidase/glutathione hydrolase